MFPRWSRTAAETVWLGPLFLITAALSVAQPKITINEYPLPRANLASNAWELTEGPDGAMWFPISCGLNPCPYGYQESIGRISPDGTITEYALMSNTMFNSKRPFGITAGSDGALWFTEMGESKIGRISTAGAITEYFLPSYASPYSITVGPDGALWFTESNSSPSGNGIGRITTAGVLTTYSSRGETGLITMGPDGALWSTDVNSIRRISVTGMISKYDAPAGCNPYGITTGPDGALWFTCFTSGLIGRITTTGIIRMYNVPTPNSGPVYIVRGPDGAMWFTEQNSCQIGRVTADGIFTEYPAGHSCPPVEIAAGMGSLWFSERGYIAQIVLSERDTKRPVSHVMPLAETQTSANFTVQWSGTDSESGIRAYTIYVADNGGSFLPWLNFTPATQAPFSGVALHRYEFFSIAQDVAGNRESLKTVAEATTQMAARLPGDLNADGRVDCLDIALIKSSIGKRLGQPGFDARADVYVDGIVDIRDLAWVSQNLPAGARCP
jgi:streptogramin lyase